LTAGELTLPDEFTNNTLIFICNGDSEEMLNYVADSYYEVVISNGVPLVYYVTRGGHDFSVWKNGLHHFARNIFH